MRYDRSSFERAQRRDLEALYLRAKDSYYSTSKSLMTDAQFDLLEDVLKTRFPKSTVLRTVGPATLPAQVQKVKLPAFMGSLSKIKADGSASEFVRRHPGPYTLSDKIDGVSVLHEVKGGVERLYSRGKGSVGFDVSALLGHVQGVGRATEGQLTRGELVVPNSSFAAHSGTYENPRAMMSGIMNRAAKSRQAAVTASSVVFYAHQLVRPRADLVQAAPKLKSQGWKVVPFEVLRSLTPDDADSVLSKHLARRKGKSKVDIDGIVVTAGDGVTMAFKGQDEEGTAEVDRVVWQPSRYGMLNPVAVFREGIRLAGVTITNVTVHNAKTVRDLGIGRGAVVRVIRSGEVIPRLTGVVKRAKPMFPPPDTWRWNDTGVDILANKGNKEVDDAVKTRRLVSFVHELGVEGLKSGLASRLVESGVDNPLRLVAATQSKLVRAGLGPTQSERLVGDLHSALDRATHVDMMYASGLFARGWGRRRFNAVLSAISYDNLVELARGGKQALYDRLVGVPGLERTLIEQLQRSLPVYDRWIARMKWAPSSDVPVVEHVSGPLSGRSVVFTKVRDRDAAARIQALGGTVSDRVSDSTLYVVVPDMGVTSTKLRAAEAKGVKVVTVDALASILTKLESRR